MLKRLSDLNPFRSPGAESAGSEEVTSRSHPSLLLLTTPPTHLLQDEDAEYEQLKKDVIANTRRLVLEPFIIATAAAVGLNFGIEICSSPRLCCRPTPLCRHWH